MLAQGSKASVRLSVLILAGSLVVMAGCAKPTKQTEFMKSSGKIVISADELRTRMRSQAGIFAGAIEESADIIMQETDDPEVYQLALLWKSRAIPAVYQAAFRPDPLMALLDTWGFAIQMRNLFESDTLRENVDIHHALVLETAIRLEKGIEEVARLSAIEADASIAKERLEEWALEHPIRNRTFSRTAITQMLQDRVVTKRKGGLAGVGDLTVDLSDLVARIGLYMEHMPKQAAWEAELILTGYLPEDELREFLDDVPEALQGLDASAAVLDDLPELVARERTILLEAVRDERLAVMEEIHRELDRAFAVVSSERSAAFAGLQVEREAIQEEVQRQRIATLDAISAEREVAFEEAEAIAMRITTEVIDRVESTIDRVMIKVGIFAGAAVLLITLAGLILLRGRRQASAVG